MRTLGTTARGILTEASEAFMRSSVLFDRGHAARRRSPAIFLSLLSAGLLSGLAGCGAPPPERFEVVIEDGIPVTTTRGGPLLGEGLFVAEPLLQLHQRPDRPESMLYRPGRFQPGPDGNYYLEDRGNGRIAVFGPEGSFLRAFGRTGEGPGEFRMPDIQSVRVGRITVFDYQLQRATIFDLSGSLLDVVRLGSVGYVVELDALPDGRLVARTVKGRDEGHVGYHQDKTTVYAPGGLDTLAHVVTPFTPSSYIEAMEGGVLSTGLPFAGRATTLYVPDHGIAVFDGYTPEIAWYALDGSLVRLCRMDIPSGPVSEDLKSAHENWLAERRRMLEAEGRTLSPPRRQYYPDRVGIWSRVMADEHGWLWLLDARDETMHQAGADFLYHIVDAEGRYLGTARLPARTGIIQNGRLHALIEDPESGEIVPTVLSLHPAVEGLAYPPPPSGR